MVTIKLLVDNIGEVLKQARLEKKMLLKDVYLATGLSLGYISRIENGSSIPSYIALIKLCNTYALDINEYVDRVDGVDNEKIDLKGLLLNGNLIYSSKLLYDGKEISIKDRLHILRFVDLIMNSNDDEIKDCYMDILENFNKINKRIKEFENE